MLAKPTYTTKYFNCALHLEYLDEIALSDKIEKAYLENILNKLAALSD